MTAPLETIVRCGMCSKKYYERTVNLEDCFSLMCPACQSAERLAEEVDAVKGRKDTNPKDAVGIKKPPMSTVPNLVLQELGVAMLEGARKYGRHNYRDSAVRASVYYDALMRHAMTWWEGEDIDPDSGLSHITKAIATLTVLRDGMISGKWVDDRPPVVDLETHKIELQKAVDAIFARHPDAKPAHTQSNLEG